MVRGPCCEKMGLKRGPWTPEEDQVLISYIQQFGHGNWRALPKQAGLLRCGKSCRLRWTNYLRPDIKRGNFTREEEDTIIKLHQMLGNRWSAIAARLPGRTDNEIKNVWHTHLKKRLKQNQTTTDTRQPRQPIQISKSQGSIAKGSKPEPSSNSEDLLKTGKRLECPAYDPVSPQQSSSGFSNGTGSDSTCDKINIKEEEFIDSWDTMPQPDETLWSQLMPMEHFSTLDEFSSVEMESQLEFPQSYIPPNHCSNMDESLEFWHDIFAKAGEISELPEF